MRKIAETLLFFCITLLFLDGVEGDWPSNYDGELPLAECRSPEIVFYNSIDRGVSGGRGVSG